MLHKLLFKKISKQTLNKKFFVKKNQQEVERILHHLLHEMGYRAVTANQWELAGPTALGLYRQKWIPERFIDIHFQSQNNDDTRVEIMMTYYLSKRRFKYKIQSLFESELEIIKEVIIHGKVDADVREEILVKSLEKDSGLNNIYVIIMLLAITLALVMFIIFIPGTTKWIVLSGYVILLAALLYWFHFQSK